MKTQWIGRGQVVVTSGVDAFLDDSKITECLRRHFSGDFGELCAEDLQANQDTVRLGLESREERSMVLSSYSVADVDGHDKVWVVTDPGWDVTTVLFPEEY